MTIIIPPNKKARAREARKAREKRLEDLNAELARSIKASEALASQLAKAREQMSQELTESQKEKTERKVKRAVSDAVNQLEESHRRAMVEVVVSNI